MTFNLSADSDNSESFSKIWYVPSSYSGDENALNRLAAQPETLSRVDTRGWIPLHEAAAQQNKKVLEIIFSGKCSCNFWLAQACSFQPWGVDRFLGVWVPASPPGAAQCRTLKGETPLFLAVVHGLRENATFLLQNGSNPDLQNDEQDSPLVAGISHYVRLTSNTFYFRDTSTCVTLSHPFLSCSFCSQLF